MAKDPECVWALGGTLLEGPVWVARDAALWFVDIKQHKLHRFDPKTGEKRTVDAPGQSTFVLPTANGAFVVGVDRTLQRFQPVTGAFSQIAEVEADTPGNRTNDGTVDPAGRLWFGTMDNGENADTGRLYRVGPDGVPAPAGPGAPITNGPAFSPDGRTCYFNDTVRRTIWAYKASEEGILSDARVFASIEEGVGNPDGPCVDADGYLWVALFGGGRVRRYAPGGKLVDEIHFPASNISKPAFGGEDLRTLYVTTARHLLDEAAQKAQPLAGGLFAVDAGVKGLAIPEARL